MSNKEYKAPRPLQDIQRDYQNLSMRAGHLQYQIVTLGKDLDLVNEELRDLNFEAAAVQKGVMEQAQKEAEEKAKQDAAAKAAEKPAEPSNVVSLADSKPQEQK